MVPCFSISHSPGPHSLSPVLSTNRCKGSASPPASVLRSPRLGHLHRCGPPAQGGVVRHAQREAKQADDGADQAFGLPERQAEHSAHGQRRQDGELRIPGLPAPGRPGFGRPRVDRLLGEPHRQAATLP